MEREETGSPNERLTTTTLDPNPIRGGILCPDCGCPHHFVTHTTQSETKFWGRRKQFIHRRRVCRHCGLPFQTREVIIPEVPKKIKHPSDAKKMRAAEDEVLRNILPREDDLGPDLPNPYL